MNFQKKNAVEINMILVFEHFLSRRCRNSHYMSHVCCVHEPFKCVGWCCSTDFRAALLLCQLGARGEGFGDCREHSSLHPRLVAPPAAHYIFLALELRSSQLLTHLAFQKRVQGMENHLWHVLASLPISTSFMWLRVKLCCWRKKFVFIYAKTFSSASSVSLSKQFHDVSIQLSHWQCFLIHLAGEAKINFIARSGKNSFRAWNPIR